MRTQAFKIPKKLGTVPPRLARVTGCTGFLRESDPSEKLRAQNKLTRNTLLGFIFFFCYYSNKFCNYAITSRLHFSLLLNYMV